MILIPDADMEPVGVNKSATFAKLDDRFAVSLDMSLFSAQRHAIDRRVRVASDNRVDFGFDMAHQRRLIDGEFEKTFFGIRDDRCDRILFDPFFQRLTAVGEFYL